MSDETLTDTWTALDAYFEERLGASDAVMDAILAASAKAGLPAIAVSPSHGKMLHLLARAIGARRILEIGTLGGYSATWFARALPADGRLVTLEFDPHHAAVARANFEAAGVAAKIELREGRAVDGLAALAAEKAAPFDLIFIDADKPSNPQYLEGSLKLSRPGTLIICDNVVRGGAVLDGRSEEANVRGVRAFMDMVAKDPRLSATAVQTVGAKGYDGFAMVLVGEG